MGAMTSSGTGSLIVVTSLGFAPQLERKREVTTSVNRRIEVVFFIAKSFKKYVDTYYEK
jgi:hypothetical protein